MVSALGFSDMPCTNSWNSRNYGLDSIFLKKNSTGCWSWWPCSENR